ncbi:MAG: trigger factor [Candidatus Tokpelaia sp. JSC161]|jgi:trigger factor|nr:MAG: trigger factor [Candidatus Tokpelaia sp. JSC161]
MKITEMLNKGLKREIKIIIPAIDLRNKLEERLIETKNKIKIKGFRKGKVPETHMHKMYSKPLMVEIIHDILKHAPHSILEKRGERSTTKPQLNLNEQELEKVVSGSTDLSFTLNYEIFPHIEVKNPSTIKITRRMINISDADIEEEIKNIACTYIETNHPAETGDRITIDYLGTMNDKPFKKNMAHLILGEKRGIFPPSFEQYLIGKKSGDHIQIHLTFPPEHEPKSLANQTAIFEVQVKKVAQPNNTQIDDAAAQEVGFKSLSHLRDIVKKRMTSQCNSIINQEVKYQILNALDKEYQFEVPETLVEIEFKNICQQISELQKTDLQEKDARNEYYELAKRRVRLSCILSAIGQEAKIIIKNKDIQHAIHTQIHQDPKNKQEILTLLRNPTAIIDLHALLYEEKVIQYLLEKISIKEILPENLKNDES